VSANTQAWTAILTAAFIWGLVWTIAAPPPIGMTMGFLGGLLLGFRIIPLRSWIERHPDWWRRKS
jgi:xanthosine utilization system XapX-like protein